MNTKIRLTLLGAAVALGVTACANVATQADGQAAASSPAVSAATSPAPSTSSPPSGPSSGNSVPASSQVSGSATSPTPSPAETTCSALPVSIIDLASVRKESEQAPGTPAPDIANYGGKWPAGSDSRNFVAQISGAQSIAAHINLGPDIKADDRIVVVVSYGDFPNNTDPGPAGLAVPRPNFAMEMGAQDITSGEPAMWINRYPGCFTS